jgi:hypothetical protein
MTTLAERSRGLPCSCLSRAPAAAGRDSQSRWAACLLQRAHIKADSPSHIYHRPSAILGVETINHKLAKPAPRSTQYLICPPAILAMPQRKRAGPQMERKSYASACLLIMALLAPGALAAAETGGWSDNCCGVSMAHTTPCRRPSAQHCWISWPVIVQYCTAWQTASLQSLIKGGCWQQIQAPQSWMQCCSTGHGQPQSLSPPPPTHTHTQSHSQHPLPAHSPGDMLPPGTTETLPACCCSCCMCM